MKKNISSIEAIYLLIFRPSKLIQKTEADYLRMNSPEAIQKREQLRIDVPQSKRSIVEIRKSLFWSLVLVLTSTVSALVVGKVYYFVGCAKNILLEQVLLYLGIGILLWATLMKVGWSIQTSNGDTIPELVNESIFRLLYVVGSFLLVLSGSLTYNG